jgi:hypothetical protein
MPALLFVVNAEEEGEGYISSDFVLNRIALPASRFLAWLTPATVKRYRQQANAFLLTPLLSRTMQVAKGAEQACE